MSELPLAVSGLSVAYQGQTVLRRVDFELPAGSLMGVVGPNGAGKSTLLKACLNLIPTSSGEVRFFGRPYRDVRHRVAYIPQRESVDWDFPVRAVDVVAMGLYRQIGWFRPVRKRHLDQAHAALAKMGIAELAGRQIDQLSGGQQQRVFLARALVQGADLYLMDEPFAAVDASTERAIVEILRGLRAAGKTAVVIHHDLQSVRDYFDRVLLLNGRVIATGPVEETFTAENLQAAYQGRLVVLDRLSESGVAKAVGS
ncbi:MAG: metal ABC transporter ATP-binding protein [Planctomycetaceae bacterium]|nr:MAG: metal ABC transporter ATP-binding protein [Planctomycetaceae bacterium]